MYQPIQLNTKTPHIRNSINRSPLRRGLLLIPLLVTAILLLGASPSFSALNILATGQFGGENIIWDGSRVYWIRLDGAVLSVDKQSGGPVTTHNSGVAGSTIGANCDIVQDTSFLYFILTPSTSTINKVEKTSSSPVLLTDQAVGVGLAINPAGGTLYYSNFIPFASTVIEEISTQGGTPSTLATLPVIGNGFYGIDVKHFSTDNVDLHWSENDHDTGTSNNGIFRVPLIGGIISPDVSGISSTTTTDALEAPINGAAGGYLFWTETNPTPTGVLKGQAPGGIPVTLLTNVRSTAFHCFATVDSGVYSVAPLYCEQGGAIVSVPINGGTPITVVNAQDAQQPVGLTSDGSYLYWTANTDGSIRRINLHPDFSSGEVSLGNGVYYLQFPNGTPFGYYSYLTDPRFIYHFDMGYEYWFDSNDGHNGIFFYDFASNHFFYTSPSFPFPYLYDFSLNTVLYYYPDPNRSGHYTTNPRYFYNFATGQIITM
jgi:hypothetical protein